MAPGVLQDHPEISCPPCPGGPMRKGPLLKGEGDRCRRGCSVLRGLPHPSPIALPLPCPPAPILAPPVALFSQGGLRASKGPLPSGLQLGARVKQLEGAGGAGPGLAWHPCLKDRGSTAHFLPQERWQRLGISHTPLGTLAGRCLQLGGPFLGLHPHPAMQAVAKRGSYLRGRHLVLSTSNGRAASLCPSTAPPPSCVFQECLAVASWLRPLCPPQPRGRGLWLLTCVSVMLSPAAGGN